MKRLYSEESIISLKRLVERREDSRFIIGDKKSEIYVSISKIGHDILNLFNGRRKVSEIKKISSERYGRVNINKFIHNLLKHGFVDKIDGRQYIERGISEIKPIFQEIRKKHVKWLFSPAAYIIYAAIIISAVYFLIDVPGLLPSYSDYFFINRVAILAPLSFAVGWILVFLHEFAHHISARSINVPASFGITNRLHFLVAVTDVTNVYSVERKKRYRVYLSGLVADLLITSIAVIFMWLAVRGILTIPLLLFRFLKFLVLLEFLGIIWQFYFYLKTDIYYVFENLFKVNNLNRKTSLFIRELFSRFSIRKHHHFRIAHQSRFERNVVHAYSVFFFIGIGASIAALLFYELPIALTLIASSISKLFLGAMFSIYAMFYDSTIFLFFWLINQALLLYALIRNYKLYLKPFFYWVAILMLFLTNYLLVLLSVIIMIIEIKSPLAFYSILFFMGLTFGISVIWLVEKLNRISEEIMIRVFAPAITVIVSFFIASFTEYFVLSTGIATRIFHSSHLIVLVYASGISAAYVIMVSFELARSRLKDKQLRK
ncbi:MAG: hypothetical protein NTV63_01135 [Candidatus Woesearchaeota archaeon]|nr:hypothetical protein [Candidatus Woesearchaeota archaeon]